MANNEMDIVLSSDSELEEEEAEDAIARLDLLPNGRRDIRHAAANMIADMRGVSAMTRVGVRRAMRAADLVLRLNNSNLKRDVSDYLAAVNLLHTPEAQQLLRKFDCESPFKGTYSDGSQMSALEKYYFFPKHDTLYIWDRMDQRLDGDEAYAQRPVGNTFENVSLKDTVRQVASRPELLAYMRSLHPSDEMLSCFTDGDQYRTSPFFQNHPDAFQFVLYLDGVDPARSQGPKSGMHEMAHFILRILNLPPKINNSMASLFPIVIANTNDCKGTYEEILRPLVNDLIDFENGVEMHFDRNRTETIYGALVGVKGDHKAVHSLLGFIDPGNARHLCRECMISRAELHAGEIAFGVPRTRLLTERHFELLEEDEEYSTECGLRYQTVLSETMFKIYHNKNSDLMHDFSEGIIPMVLRLCLKEFVVTQRMFDLNDLNARIFAFNYGKANQKDKPNIQFSPESLRDAHRSHSMRQNAAQTILLFRVLPFLLDNIADNIAGIEHTEHYQLYMLLMRIYQVAMAPRVPRDILPLLRRYLEQFRRSWYIVFPGVNPINKFHTIMHLPETFEEKGPARQFHCFREESKNCPIKRHITTCNNFINTPKTAMEQSLIYQSNAWGGKDLQVLQKSRYSRTHVKSVQELPCAAALVALGLPPDSHVQTVKTVEIFGVEYRRSQYLLILPETLSEDGLPCFGKISTIIRPAVLNDPETVIFCVQACVTNELSERFNAYTVSLREDSPHHLIDLHDLPHHRAISPMHDYSSCKIYLSLTHAVF